MRFIKPQFAMYGFDENTASEGANIPSVGVTAGWKYAGTTFTPANGDNSAYFEVNFVNASGAKANIREYEIDSNREGSEKKEASFAKRTKHIMTKFIPEENAKIQSVSSFEQFAKQFINKIQTEGNTTVELRALLHYNNKGYASFPPFPPFLEVVEPGKESKLEKAWETGSIYQKTPPTPDSEKQEFGPSNSDVADF